MTTQQGQRHASFVAIHTGSPGSYNGDARAAFAAEATIPAGATFNGAFMIWLQTRLSSSNPNLNGLMAEFAANESADRWSSVGTIDPAA